MDGKKVAFLVANEGVEEVELTEPWKAVQEAGDVPLLLAPEMGKAKTVNHLEPSGSFEVDMVVADANADDYDALVLPGGVANPDRLRTDRAAVEFVRDFVDTGKPVAAICHGPWTLVEADVVEGRTLTSWPSLQTDLRNAGANWVDEPVHIDGPLITSRRPDDLPAFCHALVRALD
jgi:protease I